jgi:hypothetical protein
MNRESQNAVSSLRIVQTVKIESSLVTFGVPVFWERTRDELTEKCNHSKAQESLPFAVEVGVP